MHPALAEQMQRQTVAFARLIVEPAGVRLQRDEVAGIPVEWTRPAAGVTDARRVVIYNRGGGYSNGDAAWARSGTARLALGLGCRVVTADYRLAPRFPFPAAHGG